MLAFKLRSLSFSVKWALTVFLTCGLWVRPGVSQSQDVERHLLFLEYPGFPDAHSSWGSIGYSTQHDKVFIGVTNHRDKIGLYEYDVPTRKLGLLGFIGDMVHLRREEWQGKIHSYLVEGPDGNMYFSTDGRETRCRHSKEHRASTSCRG